MWTKKVFLLLVCSAICVFVGRAIQFYWNDAPLRILAWDENLMRPILERYFNISWEAWTLRPENEEIIIATAQKIALLYAVAALACLGFLFSLTATFKNTFRIIIGIGVLLLIFTYFLYAKDKGYRITEFLEYAIQWGAPLLLIFHDFLSEKKLLLLLKGLCAAVFFSHGLYAMEYYPLPVSYVNMTINSLGVGEAFAKFFLNSIGYFDISAAMLIWHHRTAKYIVYYMLIWGFLTTVARLYGNWYSDMWEISMQQYFHEVLLRFGHFLLPLSLCIFFWQTREGKGKNQ